MSRAPADYSPDGSGPPIDHWFPEICVLSCVRLDPIEVIAESTEAVNVATSIAFTLATIFSRLFSFVTLKAAPAVSATANPATNMRLFRGGGGFKVPLLLAVVSLGFKTTAAESDAVTAWFGGGFVFLPIQAAEG